MVPALDTHAVMIGYKLTGRFLAPGINQCCRYPGLAERTGMPGKENRGKGFLFPWGPLVKRVEGAEEIGRRELAVIGSKHIQGPGGDAQIPVLQRLFERFHGRVERKLRQYVRGSKATLRVIVLQHRGGGPDCRQGILEGLRVKGEIHGFPIAFIERVMAIVGVIEKTEHLVHLPVEGSLLPRFPLKAEPYVCCPDDGAEAGQVMVQDKPDKASEGFGVRFVHRLHDGLPQPLLSLRREKKPRHECPPFRIGGDKERLEDVGSHGAHRVFSECRGRDYPEDLLTFSSPFIYCRCQDDAEAIVGAGPGNMGGPEGKPCDIHVMLLQHEEKGMEVLNLAVEGCLGVVGGPEAPAQVSSLVGEPRSHLPHSFHVYEYPWKKGPEHLCAFRRGQQGDLFLFLQGNPFR